jgi:hypothetical protein
MLHIHEPRNLRELLRGLSEEQGPIAWAYESGERCKASCTCDEYRVNRSCRHTWIIALLRVTLIRLKFKPMPVLALDFDRELGELGRE